MPQIILLILYFVSLLINATHYNKEGGKNKFWSNLIAVAIELGLLFWGGFFS